MLVGPGRHLPRRVSLVEVQVGYGSERGDVGGRPGPETGTCVPGGFWTALVLVTVVAPGVLLSTRPCRVWSPFLGAVTESLGVFVSCPKTSDPPNYKTLVPSVPSIPSFSCSRGNDLRLDLSVLSPTETVERIQGILETQSERSRCFTPSTRDVRS